MERHLFDSNGRVSAESVEALPVKRWLPPAIDGKGRLVPVAPKEEPRRQPDPAAGEDEQDSEVAAPVAEVSEEELEAAKSQAAQAGHAEGFAAGKQEGLTRGHEEGQQQGREQGLQEGRAAAAEELKGELARLNRLATSLSHSLNEQDYQLEQALLKLVQEVSRQVIRREMQLDNSSLMPVIREALDTLPPTRDNLRIIVNPDDMPLLEQAIDEGGENWHAVARKDVSQGGCRIETNQSVVDFTTDYRFRQVMEQVISRQLSEPLDGSEAVEEPMEEAPEPLVKPTASATADANDDDGESQA